MRQHAVPLVVVLVAVQALVPAVTDASERFQLRGFGTVGVVHSSERDADLVSNLFQPSGAGHSHEWDVGFDSKLALQFDAALADELSAVVQVVSQRRADGSFMPQLEWANLKYRVTPDLSLRAGRTVLGTFLVSDTRLLGYANPWVRPPIEVYGLLPVTSTDGIDGIYRFTVGAAVHSTQLSFGRTDLEIPGDGEVSARRILGLNHTIEQGPLTLRVGLLRSQVDAQSAALDALFGGFTEFAGALSTIPPLADRAGQVLGLIDRYAFVDRRISAMTVGAVYDPGEWMLMAEWGRLDGPPVLADSTAWTLTAGRRVGSFTPYLTFAQRDSDAAIEPGIPLTGLPAPLAASAAALNAGLQATLTDLAVSQRSVSAGLRWDFAANAALKLQFDHIRRGAGSFGTFINRQPGFEPGGRSDVVSVSVDFVF